MFRYFLLMLIGWVATIGSTSAATLNEQLQKPIQELVARIQDKTNGKSWRIAVDKIIHAQYKSPSPASDYLRSKIELIAQDHFTLISRDSLDFEKARREIHTTYGDEFDEDTRVDVGQFLGCDAFLKGTYYILTDHVSLTLELVIPMTMKKLALAEIDLSKKTLPKGLSFLPNVSSSEKDKILDIVGQRPNNSSFQIEVWPDRGNGEIYKKGEHLSLYFRTSQDCYVRLFHISPTDSIQYLFPEPPDQKIRIEANKTYSIPDENYGYAWPIQAPFGIDHIVAIASTKPFEDLPQTTDVGIYTKENTQTMLTRGIGKQAKTAQATCVFTTVE